MIPEPSCTSNALPAITTRQYLLLGSCILVVAGSFFLFELPSSAAIFIKDHFSLNSAQYALMHTVLAVMGSFGPSVLGLMSVKYGLGTVFMGSAIACALSQVLLYVSAAIPSPSYALFLVGRGLFGAVVDVLFSFSEATILTSFSGGRQAAAYSCSVFVSRMASCASYTLIPGVAADMGLLGTLLVTMVVSGGVLLFTATTVKLRQDPAPHTPNKAADPHSHDFHETVVQRLKGTNRVVSDRLTQMEEGDGCLCLSGPVSLVVSRECSDDMGLDHLIKTGCNVSQEASLHDEPTETADDMPSTDNPVVQDLPIADTLSAPSASAPESDQSLLATLLDTGLYDWLTILVAGSTYCSLFLFTYFFPLQIANLKGYDAEEASFSMYVIFLVNAVVSPAVLNYISLRLSRGPPWKILAVAMGFFVVTFAPDMAMMWLDTCSHSTVTLLLALKGVSYTAPTACLVYMQTMTSGPRLAFQISTSYSLLNLIVVVVGSVLGGRIDSSPYVFSAALLLTDIAAVASAVPLLVRDIRLTKMIASRPDHKDIA
ncbi:major facilitator superfamily protein [Kipferlia bialata]|uniref:Lysosomal dipeptide transporter MFSD1 n=1 Tax=Kipferlia bialata TaxID=797122 RepID=A0A9K3CWY3_9EUKA|nr:major facilitator superfamily protein [Kipferlia bialata]|eukprot:g5337.t1